MIDQSHNDDQKESLTTREGGCLCGAVRYRVAGEPVLVGICHCETCRRVSSGPSLPFASFAEADFAITRGTPASFRSSSPVIRGFCGRCGSPLTYRHAAQPGLVDVMVGSLDDPGSVPPTVHLWVDEKIAWDVVADGLPAHREGSGSDPAATSGSR